MSGKGFVYSLIGLLSPEQERGAGVPIAERAAGAVHERDPAVAPPAPRPTGAVLLHRLDDEEDAAHPGMIRAEAAAVRVDRQRTAELDAAVRHEGPALALLAETEVFERDQHRDRERVVDHAHVDV